MENREDKYQTRFASADEMVASAIPQGIEYSTLPGSMEVSALKTLLKGVLWLLIGVVLAVALKLTIDIPLESALAVIILPFIIYALMKGVRARPDAIAIADDKLWLFTDVLYNAKTKTWGYDELIEIAKNEIKKAWTFQLFTIKFKVPGKISVKHQQNLFMKLGKYYTHNPINIGKAKQLLFKS